MPLLFTPPEPTPAWLTALITLIGLGWLALALRLGARARGRAPHLYSAELAWLRAGLYFGMCWLLSAATGVLPTLLARPVATAAQLAAPAWWAFTGLCLAVVGVAYGVVWPRGTLTHGRALHLPSVLVFGLAWGVSEGQLFLVFWALVERWAPAPWVTGLVVFGVIAVFNGLWHSRYWDLYVAPEHNIPEWNPRKVFLAHIPNLVVTLTYLGVHGNAALFVLFQTLGLLASTYFMRFPPYWADRATGASLSSPS